MNLPKDGINLPKLLQTLESSYIDQALHRAGHNTSKAARLLGIKRTTLREKLKRLGFVVAPPDLASVVEDPDGEFTWKRTGKGYSIYFNGEKIAFRHTRTEVNDFIKEKME
jgi:hypothetical protein